MPSARAALCALAALAAALAGCRDREGPRGAPSAAAPLPEITIEERLPPPPIDTAQVRRVTECNEFIRTASAAREELREVSAKLKDSDRPEDIERMGAAYDRVADALAALPLTDARLQRISRDYQSLSRRAAESCRAMARAARKQDAAGLDAVAGALRKVGPEEKQIVAAMNAYCATGK
jgi:hypothetical protein